MDKERRKEFAITKTWFNTTVEVISRHLDLELDIFETGPVLFTLDVGKLQFCAVKVDGKFVDSLNDVTLESHEELWDYLLEISTILLLMLFKKNAEYFYSILDDIHPEYFNFVLTLNPTRRNIRHEMIEFCCVIEARNEKYNSNNNFVSWVLRVIKDSKPSSKASVLTIIAREIDTAYQDTDDLELINRWSKATMRNMKFRGKAYDYIK